MLEDKIIGKVTHYFDKIGVAVVKLNRELKLGDKVTIKGKNNFDQHITSIQVEHQPIERAEKGQEVAIKVDQPVKENDVLVESETLDQI